MSKPTRNQLLKMVRRIREECDMMEQMIEQIKPEKEWLTTAEFADRANLSAKSVSTYCSMGRFDRAHKNGNGQWKIHKSELSQY